MIELDINCLCWNPRGLNCPNRRDVVSDLVASTSCHIVCLQETKLQSVDSAMALHLGGYRLRNFAQKPADGTKGGILILWDDRVIQFLNVTTGTFSLSGDVAVCGSDISFKLTVVYGPTRGNLKDAFFAELAALKPMAGTKWLVNGDFNQIYKANDKNRGNANRSRIVRFRNALNSCELKEIHLQNRKFTWSNERQDPTLCKLDGFFCNEEWDITFPDHILHALSSSLSDHCPLLLANAKDRENPKPFALRIFGSRCRGSRTP